VDPDWISLVLGPLGALVLSVTLLATLLRELRRKHQAELARLDSLLAERAREVSELSDRLTEEHAGRLADARETTRTLMDLNDRIHQTLERLETLTRPRR